ncbi:MAG TPA: hypothetical protein VJH65_00925 [Candidatus Nanoarchaeia archaeon]|nr:hypothetical protein [Candidatus Nanoarchaeia archaeon]
MAKLTAWLVTVLGVLLLLPLLGVTQLGTPTEGVLGWLVALVVLAVGIGKLVRNYKKK